MSMIPRAAALAALLMVLAGCDLGGGGSKSAVDEAQFVVDEFVYTGLQQPGDEEGTRAGLSAAPGGKTRVVIEMRDPSDPLLRAEIRRGSCDAVGSGLDYLLNDVRQGESSTVLDLPVREFFSGEQGYTIMVHRLNPLNEFTGLCGDLALAEEN
jgi:hypothetical protein